MEHFATSYDQIKDPIAMKDLIVDIATNNELVYYDIFRCEPHNYIKTFRDVVKIRKDKDEIRTNVPEFKRIYLEKKDMIRGHAVLYP